MDSIKVFVETGSKKVFAGAVDWPGWCRSGRSEETALQSLLDYGARYAQILSGSGIEFQAPTNLSEFIVIERHAGNPTTDFGVPAIVLDGDRGPVDLIELEHLQVVLTACWQAFDRAMQRAAGRELQKGPRGGGRDLEAMIEHILGGDQSYLTALGWKYKLEGEKEPSEALAQTREAIRNALSAAARAELPARGPRGGIMWPVRYYIRRAAWHVVDHIWEIEDRIL